MVTHIDLDSVKWSSSVAYAKGCPECGGEMFSHPDTFQNLSDNSDVLISYAVLCVCTRCEGAFSCHVKAAKESGEWAAVRVGKWDRRVRCVAVSEGMTSDSTGTSPRGHERAGMGQILVLALFMVAFEIGYLICKAADKLSFRSHGGESGGRCGKDRKAAEPPWSEEGEPPT